MAIKRQPTAYYDKQKPRLVESYCVFVDILGFRHEIEKAKQSDKEAVIFRRFMRLVEPKIRSIFLPMQSEIELLGTRMWDAKVFTDNIVLGFALWSGHGENELGHAISTLLEFQMAMSLEGYFVRGGWAVGKLFMNENTIYGSALIDAYHLEHQLAIYPRIVLSEEVKNIVARHLTFYAKSNPPPHCRYLIIDNQKVLAVNYLMMAAEGDSVQWELLKRHRMMVARKLSEHVDNEKVRIKYEWIAQYHNYICLHFKNERGFSSKYLIPCTRKDYGIRFMRRSDLKCAR